MAVTPAVNRIMNSARVHLPGALDSGMQYELFEVLDEFCKETGVWKEDIAFTVNTLTKDYTITPSFGNIVRLVAVITSDDLPIWATMETPGEINLKNLPTAIAVYTAKVVLTVVDPVKTDGFPVIPNWILVNYNTDLMEGLLARMMGQKNKPYSDEKLGIYHLRRFRNAMAKATVDVTHQNVQGGQTWRFPRWA